MNLEKLSVVDPELKGYIDAELNRQRDKIELIASENIVTPAVMEAMGSVLTNKYAEGYPGHRYYGGCEYVDKVETLAIERAKKLFNANFANVQAHCGASTNMAVYFAFLKPGDTIMGMDLSQGGHLSHGSPVNISGTYFNVVHYGVDKETEMIDYADIEAKAKEYQPKLIVAGASAYPRIIDFERIANIAHENGALLLVDMAHIAGLVAAGLHPSPVHYADIVTTTTHKTLRGPRGGLILTNNEEYAKKINKSIFPGLQGGPLMHVIAAKAIVFKEAMEPWYVEYQKQVVANAKLLAQEVMKRGYKVVAGGTHNHLFLMDFIGLEMTGKDAEAALGKAFITVNKNTVPGEPRSPFITSGIRVGTPACTRRGFKEAEIKELASIMCDVLDNYQNDEVILKCRERVKALCAKFPVYKD